MSFFGDGDFLDIVFGGKADILDLGGQQGEDESREASLKAEEELLTAQDKSIAETRRATAEGQAFLQPFGGVGLQGAEQAGFLTDPQAQFDFLQSNPLFQLSLDNANTQTNKFAASRGRLSAGDTLQQLSNNVLLSAAPLIQSQKQSIGDLLNLGVNVAGNQGSLLTGQGASLAGGIVGSANVNTAGANVGAQNINNLAGILSGALANQG